MTDRNVFFEYHRLSESHPLPATSANHIDVALLDMNHEWPNVGHDAIVHAVREMARRISPQLTSAHLALRVISFDIRKQHRIPEPPGERFSIYLATGGPGHIDPTQNDGLADGTQGIAEDPSWEEPLYNVFDQILADRTASLFAVCHTFGVLCRWSGIARPSLRGAEKGGKSSGVLENVLSSDAALHPWFARFREELPEGGRFRILDSRLYDLIPLDEPLPAGMTVIASETAGKGGPPGDAITALELARDPNGIMPRVLAVNHHPEIIDRAHQVHVLGEKFSRGEVTREWFDERMNIFAQHLGGEDVDSAVRLTSEFTFLKPIEYQIHRLVRLRRQAAGLDDGFHEDQLIEPFFRGAREVATPVSA